MTLATIHLYFRVKFSFNTEKRELNGQRQGGLATAFDLAAFRLSMIAPVKKSVNHPKTVASMRGTGWENNKFVLAAFSKRFGSVK